MDGQNFCIEMYRNGCFSKASIRFHSKKKELCWHHAKFKAREWEKRSETSTPQSGVGWVEGRKPFGGVQKQLPLAQICFSKNLGFVCSKWFFLGGGGDSTMWCITESPILRHLGEYACSAFFSKCKDSKTIQVSIGRCLIQLPSKPGFPSIIPWIYLPPNSGRRFRLGSPAKNIILARQIFGPLYP